MRTNYFTNRSTGLTEATNNKKMSLHPRATLTLGTFPPLFQELSDFIILVKSGLPVGKALLFNLLSSLSSVVGVIIAVSIGQVVSPRIPI